MVEVAAVAAETELWGGACTHDVLTEFLCAMEPLNQVSLQSDSERGRTSATNSSAKSCSSKAQRRSSRGQIQELLRQIESLQSEVDGLRVNQLLGDSLEQFLHPRCCHPRWRLIATHEKQATAQATAENARLKKRLRENHQLIKRARKLMQSQIAYVQARCFLPLPTQPLPIESDVNDARICSMLRISMDLRCRQMDQLLAQRIPTESVIELSTVISHASGVGVDFEESHIVPLDVETSSDALFRSTDLESEGRNVDEDRLYVNAHVVQLDADGAYRSVRTWLLQRRIELQHRSVVLWESFDQWLPIDSSTSSPIEVYTSTWATADPIPKLGENGSFLQIAVSVRARGAGSNKRVSPELNAILHFRVNRDETVPLVGTSWWVFWSETGHVPSSSSAAESKRLRPVGGSMQESAVCGSQWLLPFDDLLRGMTSVPSLEELFVAASAPLMEIIPDTTSESSATSEAGSMSSTKSLEAEVQELQHEIETLMHQVESLRANQLLGDSLEQFLSPKRYRPNYRLLATDAKQAAELAQTENARLKTRVRERKTQIRSVRRLLNKQFAIAKIRQISALDPPRSSLFTNQDADLCIYSMLCSNLDMRCAQLAPVLSQCASVTVPTELSQVVLHADGAGVDFKTSRVLPFDAEIVCRALYKAVNVDSVLDSNLFVKRKAVAPQAHGITKRKATTGQSLLRRIDKPNQVVLVWESFEKWSPRSDTSSSRERWPAIHGASWAVIEQLPELRESACFLQTVTSIRMQVDKQSQVETQSVGKQDMGLILQFVEQFIIQQRRLVGKLLVDMSLKPSEAP